MSSTQAYYPWYLLDFNFHDRFVKCQSSFRSDSRSRKGQKELRVDFSIYFVGVSSIEIEDQKWYFEYIIMLRCCAWFVFVAASFSSYISYRNSSSKKEFHSRSSRRFVEVKVHGERKKSAAAALMRSTDDYSRRASSLGELCRSAHYWDFSARPNESSEEMRGRVISRGSQLSRSTQCSTVPWRIEAHDFDAILFHWVAYFIAPSNRLFTFSIFLPIASEKENYN